MNAIAYCYCCSLDEVRDGCLDDLYLGGMKVGEGASTAIAYLCYLSAYVMPHDNDLFKQALHLQELWKCCASNPQRLLEVLHGKRVASVARCQPAVAYLLGSAASTAAAAAHVALCSMSGSEESRALHLSEFPNILTLFHHCFKYCDPGALSLSRLPSGSRGEAMVDAQQLLGIDGQCEPATLVSVLGVPIRGWDDVRGAVRHERPGAAATDVIMKKPLRDGARYEWRRAATGTTGSSSSSSSSSSSVFSDAMPTAVDVGPALDAERRGKELAEQQRASPACPTEQTLAVMDEEDEGPNFSPATLISRTVAIIPDGIIGNNRDLHYEDASGGDGQVMDLGGEEVCAAVGGTDGTAEGGRPLGETDGTGDTAEGVAALMALKGLLIEVVLSPMQRVQIMEAALPCYTARVRSRLDSPAWGAFMVMIVAPDSTMGSVSAAAASLCLHSGSPQDAALLRVTEAGAP